jgi:hypothetical protein
MAFISSSFSQFWQQTVIPRVREAERENPERYSLPSEYCSQVLSYPIMASRVNPFIWTGHACSRSPHFVPY